MQRLRDAVGYIAVFLQDRQVLQCGMPGMPLARTPRCLLVAGVSQADGGDHGSARDSKGSREANYALRGHQVALTAAQSGAIRI